LKFETHFICWFEENIIIYFELLIYFLNTTCVNAFCRYICTVWLTIEKRMCFGAFNTLLHCPIVEVNDSLYTYLSFNLSICFFKDKIKTKYRVAVYLAANRSLETGCDYLDYEKKKKKLLPNVI